MNYNQHGLSVLEALRLVSTQNLELIKPAEENLRTWESSPGFHSILLTVVLDYTIDINIRWQAVIYFKNGVDRYWRMNMENGISQEEKNHLRNELLKSFSEPVNQIATQLAVVIAKIARVDCPQRWPELLPSLLNAVNNNEEEEIVQHRALLVLNNVIKSFVTKRLASDRQIFYELTNNILNIVLRLWNLHTETSLIQTAQRDSNTLNTLQKALLCLKVLRKLVVHGCKDPHKNENIVAFLNLIFERLVIMLKYCHSVRPHEQMREVCEKYIILMIKILTDILEHHPFSFLQFIQPSLGFVTTYVFCPENEGFLFEQFTVHSLNLVKGIIMHPEYKSRDEIKGPAVQEARKLKEEFFTPTMLGDICLRLLSHYFLLTKEDLVLWDEDPEGFAIEEGGEAWKFSIRPCTEVLFLALFHEFRQILTPLILDLISRHSNPCDASDLQALLQKDAIYNAVGLASFDLFDEVNFDEWFSSKLVKELSILESNYKIIRRRLIWLVGQWVGVKFSPDLRPSLYETILPLLRVEEDLVVRITAARTLKVSVDDFEFNTQQFHPYLEPSFRLLFQLLKDVTEGDSKMHVLNVLSFIIERVGSAIRPHARGLVQYLPLLWNESTDHNMLRCAILSTLVHMIKGLGSLSETLYSFMVPILHLSTDVSQPPHVYLLEDGLDLWLAALENATFLHPAMINLFENIMPILEYGSENLRICLYIIRAFLLLDSEVFKQNFVSRILKICCELLPELRREGVILILQFFDVLLKAIPSDGPRICQPAIYKAIPAVLQSQDTPMVLAAYMAIIARSIIQDVTSVDEVLEYIARESSKTSEEVFGRFLDSWIRALERDPQPETRKLCGIALASLLTSNSRVVNDRFCGVILAIVEVLHDVTNIDESGAKTDSLVMNGSNFAAVCSSEEDGEVAREQDKRMKKLRLNDPVHTVDLRKYLQSQLEHLRQMSGLAVFDDLMQTLDVETLQQLQDFVKDP